MSPLVPLFKLDQMSTYNLNTHIHYTVKYKYALKIATQLAELLETNPCKYSADLDIL